MLNFFFIIFLSFDRRADLIRAAVLFIKSG